MFRKSGYYFMSTNYQVKFPACNQIKYPLRLILRTTVVWISCGNEIIKISFHYIRVLINLTEISLHNSPISNSLLRVSNDRKKDCIVMSIIPHKV